MTGRSRVQGKLSNVVERWKVRLYILTYTHNMKMVSEIKTFLPVGATELEGEVDNDGTFEGAGEAVQRRVEMKG